MKISKDIPDIFKVKWSHHATRSGITFPVSYIHLWGYMNVYPKYLGDRFKYLIVESKGLDWVMWRQQEDIDRLRKKLAKKCQRFGFVQKRYKKMARTLDNYYQYGNKLKKINFQKLNNIQLARIYHEYYWQSPNSATTASTLIELISAFGLVLEQKIRNKGFTEQQTKDFMMVLASPLKVTLPLEEEIKFLELVKKIGKKSVMKLPTADLKLAKRHFNKYRWLSVYFSGQAWAWDNFVVRVKKAQLAGHISKRISKLKSDRIITDKKVKSIMKQTGLLKKEVTLFRKMIFYRIQIENYYSYVNYQATGLINQTAKRLKIALNQLSFLLVNEAGQALVGKIAGLMEKITIRQKYYLMVMGRKQVHIYTGQQAKKIKNKFQIKKQASGKVKQIQGICGHPGRVTGKARIIVDFNKLGKFKSGEILITSNTTPLFVPAIKAAKAVIADEGGVTCHAAIVSRELGIPCVINTQVGTKFFKDGDKVLVDAEKGIVRKL